jgi:hypothetical protein
MIKDNEKKIIELVEKAIKQYLLQELDQKGIESLFMKQYNLNFKNHKKYFNDLIMKGISPEFVDFNNGVAVFKCKSATWNSVKQSNEPTEYTLGIRFFDWDKFFDDPNLSMNQRMDRLMKGNLGIGCNCNSFRYNYGYQTVIKGSMFYDEQHSNQNITAKPVQTNPSGVGIGCKHLHRLLNKYNYKLYIRQKVKETIIEKMQHVDYTNVTSPSAPNSVKFSQSNINQKNKKR